VQIPKISHGALALALLGCSGGGDDSDRNAASSVAPLGGSPVDPTLPEYTLQGELVWREDWPEWVFLGTSLNLTYAEEPVPTDFFANVFMEPSAFTHFKQTGEFRDGTMTAAVGYLASADVAPAETGQFQGEAVVFEMSVKDSVLDAGAPWRYYSFTADSLAARANPREACFDCHTEHAATDHVFTQFYPVLRGLVGER